MPVHSLAHAFVCHAVKISISLPLNTPPKAQARCGTWDLPIPPHVNPKTRYLTDQYPRERQLRHAEGPPIPLREDDGETLEERVQDRVEQPDVDIDGDDDGFCDCHVKWADEGLDEQLPR